MSRESQDIFRYSIPADNSFESRISITLHMLKPVQIEATPSPINQDVLPFKSGYSRYESVPGNFFDLPGKIREIRIFRGKK